MALDDLVKDLPLNLFEALQARDLKPPVCNKVIWENDKYLWMLVGSPNHRTDYHVNQREEFFYQVKGNMVIRVVEDKKFLDIPLKEGDVFLLPPRVPHSIQRPAGGVGFVMEYQRLPHELDGFQWYCSECGEKLYEEYFHLKDIVQELPPVFARFYADISHRTCKHCGYVVPDD